MATVEGKAPTVSRAGSRTQHRALAVLTAVMAAAGYAGAVGLIGRGVDFGAQDAVIVARLPWHSKTLAGIGLALSVAVPMTTCAVLAWRGSARAGLAALVAGGALVGWIIVEVLIVRTYSWMQPACLAWGLVVAGVGRRIARSRT